MNESTLVATFAVAIVVQAAVVQAPLGLLWIVPLCGLAWQVGVLRHGVGSLSLGGLGMALGAVVDGVLGWGASCHSSGLWSVATAGMLVGCTLSCVWICRRSSSPAMGATDHVLMWVGMFGGEQAAIALGALVGSSVGHWGMVVGMAIGTVVGALVARLRQMGTPVAAL